MTWVKWAMLVYALAMISMGVHGYVGSQSVASLAGGGGLGALVLIGLWMSLKMATPRAGYILASVVCLLAIGRFLPAYLGENGKLYPHLVIVVLSLSTIACLLGGHFAAQAAKKKST